MQLKEARESAKKMIADNDTAVIAIDFQKNLPLTLTGVTQEFYKRQLWIHNFCIYDCVNENATMLLYVEHYARKGRNEVISYLDYFISTLPSSMKKLKIFADNCFSQNKNKLSTLWRIFIRLFIATWRKSKFSILFQDIADYPAIVISLALKSEDEGKIEW